MSVKRVGGQAKRRRERRRKTNRVVESRRDRMGLDDLSVLGLEKVRFDSVKDSRDSEGEGGRVSVGFDS
jgi:hypothetical protein